MSTPKRPPQAAPAPVAAPAAPAPPAKQAPPKLTAHTPAVTAKPKPTIETKLASLEAMNRLLNTPPEAMIREMERARPVLISPTPKAGPTESDKWKHLAAPYLRGNGIELATGGSPIVASSIQFELPPLEYAHYNSSQPLRGPVQWRSTTAVADLPFKDGVLDYVASSHLLEDFGNWWPLLTEWVRVLRKPGGRLLVCLPDKKRWAEALAKGQPPNCAHKHEAFVGELSTYAAKLGLSVICDKFTNVPPGDYNILFLAEVM